MKTKLLAFASILAISTAAFAQAPAQGPGPDGQREMKPTTRAEALAKAGSHFDKVDTNKDGVIDAAERKAAHMKHRERMEQHRADGPGKGAAKDAVKDAAPAKAPGSQPDPKLFPNVP